MSRWQIRALYFYSHDNRRTDLHFKPSAVNIIVGPSYTGKSAIIEAVDYCMGAGECHIPGIVRESCSWVGLHWFRDKTEVLMCRRLPPSGKSNEDMHFAVGSPVNVPAGADDLRRTSNVDGALRLFEQHIAIGNVAGETFTSRQGQRISCRNAMPYVLVSDDVIINKLTLLRGMNDERRQSIIDSLPYFLGAVDESTAANEIKLRRFRAQLEREERERTASQEAGEERAAKVAAVLQEAIQVGMLPNEDAMPTITAEMLPLLSIVADWTPGAEIDVAGNETLDALYRLERDELSTVGQVRAHLAAARDTLQSADHFGRTVEKQRRKLNVAAIFRSGIEQPTCPVCSAPITERTDTLDAVNSALAQLDGELREVRRERPQIDSYVARLEDESREALERLSSIRGRIASVIRESEANSQRLEIDQR